MSQNSLKERLAVKLSEDVTIDFRLIIAEDQVLGEKNEVTFRMGSRDGHRDEQPVHRVGFTQPYYMGIVPVTQLQYRVMAQHCLTKLEALKGNKGARPSEFEGDDLPVEKVDFHDAEVACEWLSLRLTAQGLSDEWIAGLPGEAQWEYACRKDSKTDYCNGDGEAALDLVGWYDQNADQTMPVGTKAPNAFGLHDMHGNVWEWCRDVSDAGAYQRRGSVTDGSLVPRAADEAPRVLRGGSWVDAARYCRSACRGWDWAGFRHWNFGFRVCLFPGSGGSPSQAGGQESRTSRKASAEPVTGGGSGGTERKPEGTGGAGYGTHGPAQNCRNETPIQNLLTTINEQHGTNEQ